MLKSTVKTRIFKWIFALAALIGIVVGFYTWLDRSITSFNLLTPEDPKWEPYEKMVNDIGENNTATVKADLDNGVNPNAIPNDDTAIANYSDTAALCAAAHGGNAKIVTLLLDHGADPNIVDRWDGNPLTAAINGNHIDIMKLLVQRGARVNEEKGDSYALWRATSNDKLDAVKFLLAHGANPNTGTKMGEGPSVLAIAKLSHQDAVVKLLRQAGAKE